MLKYKSEHQRRVERLMNQIPGQEIPSSPRGLSEKDRILRAKLTLEEALEKISALGVSISVDASAPVLLEWDRLDFGISQGAKVDYLKVIDSCCDGIVINTGTLSHMGIPDLMIQEAVDKANLTKFEPPVCDECELPMERVGDSESPKTFWNCPNCEEAKPREAGPYRREDRKWIKPPYFVPPEETIKQIILDLGFPRELL